MYLMRSESIFSIKGFSLANLVYNHDYSDMRDSIFSRELYMFIYYKHLLNLNDIIFNSDRISDISYIDILNRISCKQCNPLKTIDKGLIDHFSRSNVLFA
jgi:hypothetical protein